MKFLGKFAHLDTLAQKLKDLTLSDKFGYVTIRSKVYFIINYKIGWATVVAEDFGRSNNTVVSEVDYPGSPPFNLTILGSKDLTSEHEIRVKPSGAALTEGDIKWFLGDRADQYRHLIPVLLPYFDSNYPEIMPQIVSEITEDSLGKPVIFQGFTENSFDDIATAAVAGESPSNVLGPDAINDLCTIAWIILAMNGRDADTLSQLHFDTHSTYVKMLNDIASDYIRHANMITYDDDVDPDDIHDNTSYSIFGETLAKLIRQAKLNSSVVNITSEDDFPHTVSDDAKYLVSGAVMKMIYDKQKAVDSLVAITAMDQVPSSFDNATEYRIHGDMLNALTKRAQAFSTFRLEDIVAGGLPVPQEPQLFSVQQMKDANATVATSLNQLTRDLKTLRDEDQATINDLEEKLRKATEKESTHVSSYNLTDLITGKIVIPDEPQTFDSTQIHAAVNELQQQSEELHSQLVQLTETNSSLEDKMAKLQTSLQSKIAGLQEQLQSERERQKNTVSSLEDTQREFSDLLHELYPNEEVSTDRLLTRLKQDLSDGIILTDAVKQRLATLSGGDMSGSDQDLLDKIDNEISTLVSNKKESDTRIARLSDELQAALEDVRRLEAKARESASGLASNTDANTTNRGNTSERRGGNTAAYAVGAVIGFISKSLLDS